MHFVQCTAEGIFDRVEYRRTASLQHNHCGEHIQSTCRSRPGLLGMCLRCRRVRNCNHHDLSRRSHYGFSESIWAFHLLETDCQQAHKRCCLYESCNTHLNIPWNLGMPPWSLLCSRNYRASRHLPRPELAFGSNPTMALRRTESLARKFDCRRRYAGNRIPLDRHHRSRTRRYKLRPV